MSDADRIAEDLRRFVEKAVVRVSLNAQANLIERTPRVTGFAADNWVASIGDAHTGEVSAGAAAASAVSVAAGYKLDDGPVVVANNVMYIQKLNGGSSQQAPAGFVEQAVFDAVEDEQGVSVIIPGGGGE